MNDQCVELQPTANKYSNTNYLTLTLIIASPKIGPRILQADGITSNFHNKPLSSQFFGGQKILPNKQLILLFDAAMYLYLLISQILGQGCWNRQSRGGGEGGGSPTIFWQISQPGKKVYAHNFTTPPLSDFQTFLRPQIPAFVFRKVSPEVVAGEGNLAEFRKPQRNAQHHY